MVPHPAIIFFMLIGLVIFFSLVFGLLGTTVTYQGYDEASGDKVKQEEKEEDAVMKEEAEVKEEEEEEYKPQARDSDDDDVPLAKRKPSKTKKRKVNLAFSS